ncbi:MAG: hypothetical protein WC432_03680, partial [Candidatus Omnitrophota bacterium]
MSSWEIVLMEPARMVLGQISQFVVNALLVIIILLIGWLFSKLISSLVSKSLKAIKINELSSRIELDKLLSKGGINYALSDLVGVICYWLGLLVTFMVAVNSIGFTVAADLLNKVVLYIPNVIAALFILILGIFVSTLLKNIVQTAANNAGLSQGNLLSKIVEAIVILFSVFVALEQLQIGIHVTELTIS